MLDHKVIVFKARADVLMYVVGSEDENELILDTVLDGVTGALSILLGGDVSANNILEHLDVAMLTVIREPQEPGPLSPSWSKFFSHDSRPRLPGLPRLGNPAGERESRLLSLLPKPVSTPRGLAPERH